MNIELSLNPLFSVKLIFNNHWNDYKKMNKVREIGLKEVEKMLFCKGIEMGGSFILVRIVEKIGSL
jgi:hypothetical protein